MKPFSAQLMVLIQGLVKWAPTSDIPLHEGEDVLKSYCLITFNQFRLPYKGKLAT